MPKPQQEKIDYATKVADYSNDLILDPKTDEELNARKQELQDALTPKFDENGKALELPFNERIDLSAELDAIVSHLDKKENEKKPTQTTEQILANEPGEETPIEEAELPEAITYPTNEQIEKDLRENNFVTFTYEDESQVPEQFKDRISSVGEVDGKKTVRVTLPKSVADYELAKRNQPTELPEAPTEEIIIPTKENVTERLNINNPFYKKISKALSDLGLIKEYNPDTKEGDVVGGYVQSDSEGGFASGNMYFKKDGSISYIKGDVIVKFDKNGNVISENTKEAAQNKIKNEIQSKKYSIEELKKTRDSEDFKYKKITETDSIGNKKKVRKLKNDNKLQFIFG